MATPNLMAIIPAAGLSRRMGQPKLLLPWRGATVISHLVEELKAAGINQIFVVVRSNDSALTAAVTDAGATAVHPETDPPDMRASVEFGLRIAYGPAQATQSAADDLLRSGWLLIPADHPIVSRGTVAALQTYWIAGRRQIIVPTFDGRRGHPTLFSSDFVREVFQIPHDCGLNWLVKHNAQFIREVPVADPGVVTDLDTKEDYEALLKRETSAL